LFFSIWFLGSRQWCHGPHLALSWESCFLRLNLLNYLTESWVLLY